MGHLNLRNILFMFHHIHVTFEFREFGVAASNWYPTTRWYEFVQTRSALSIRSHTYKLFSLHQYELPYTNWYHQWLIGVGHRHTNLFNLLVRTCLYEFCQFMLTIQVAISQLFSTNSHIWICSIISFVWVGTYKLTSSVLSIQVGNYQLISSWTTMIFLTKSPDLLRKIMCGHQPFSYQMVIDVLTFLLLQWVQHQLLRPMPPSSLTYIRKVGPHQCIALIRTFMVKILGCNQSRHLLKLVV